MPKISFTQTAIDRLDVPAPAAGGATRQTIYYDIDQPGLAVRVTSGGAKTFVVEAWHAGRSLRVKLGRVSDLSVHEARRRAKMELGRIAAGADPNAERRAERARSVTLRDAFDAYIATHKTAHKIGKRTEYDYRRILLGARNKDGTRKLNGYLSPWLDVPVAEITETMVARRHAELARRSGAQANYAMRLLRAIANYARAAYKVNGESPIKANPVAILSETGAWVRVHRRKTVIRSHQLADWFAAVLALDSDAVNGLADVVKGYLQFLVLTGLRRSEGARLRWEDVDLKGRTFTVRDPKNHEDHTLPLSDYLIELLEALPRVNDYVFPGPGKAGHLVEPKKQLRKVIATSGVAFTLHDLRRTFITIAESIDIPAYALKRLLNHKMSGDVTAGYIITDVERLRDPMQRVTDFILRAAKVRQTATVTPIERGVAREAASADEADMTTLKAASA